MPRELIETIPGWGGLVLGIVNSLLLLRSYVRDRAKLSVSPVLPDTYQWWFRLPDSEYEGRRARIFAFLAYVDVLNRGFRPVTLERWRLRVKTGRWWGKRDLQPVNTIPPEVKTASYTKVYPVLGQGGPQEGGRARIEPGDSTGGMALFVYGCWGHDSWDPKIHDGGIRAEFDVRDVYRGSASCRVSFREKDLSFIKEFLPDIERIVAATYNRRSPKDLSDDLA